MTIPRDVAILCGTAATLALVGARWQWWAVFACLVGARLWMHRPQVRRG